MAEAAFLPVPDAAAPEPVAVAVPEVLEPDEPVTVACEAVVVADEDPVLELDAAEEVKEIVTDSDERQVAENALCADDRLSPWHFSVMFPATCGSRVPQRDLRSAGLV